ncbi:hypothetical protein JTB14_026758 [Gonioctena quinquepunctata]|nr:hypothetical protein JTB14_026758 [Gonioctena quinquepunctata]
MLLVEEVEKFKNIIECKTSDKVSNSNKFIVLMEDDKDNAVSTAAEDFPEKTSRNIVLQKENIKKGIFSGDEFPLNEDVSESNANPSKTNKENEESTRIQTTLEVFVLSNFEEPIEVENDTVRNELENFNDGENFNNNVQNNNKRRDEEDLGITKRGRRRILCDKVSPEDPYKKTFIELTEKMEQFYSPKPLEIAENIRFYQRRQQNGKSLQEYAASLQKLSIHCNFADYLKTAL